MRSSAGLGRGRGSCAILACAGAAFSLLAAGTASAVDINVNWLAAVSDNWSVSSRWSGGVVPNNNGSNFYLVTLDAAGSPYTVTVDSPFAVKDLILNSADATLALGAQALTLTRDFNFTSGTVTATSRIGSISASGTTTLNGSVFESARLNTTGTLIFAGSGTNDICDTEVDHEGPVMSWTGNGTILMDAVSVGGRITNGAPSTFTISGDGVVTQTTGPQSTFENRGTMIKNGGTGVTLFDAVMFQNTLGTVQVTTGTLKFVNSADYTSGNQKLNTGVWKVDGAGTLDFNGSIIAKNGADVTLNGVGSTFAAINSLSENSTGGKFTVTGGRQFTTAASLVNNGTITVGTGSTFRVAAGAGYTAGAGSTLDLSGTFKLDGAAVNTLTGSKITLRSGGAYVDQFGSNALNGLNAINSGGHLEVIGRNYNFGSGLTLGNGGTLTIGAAGVGNNSTVTVTGSMVYGLGSTLRVTNGTLVNTGSLLQEGLLTGNGVVQATTVQSEGEIAPGASPGTLTIDGNLHIGANSIYRCELGGPTTGQYDVLDVLGVVTFGGTSGASSGVFDLTILPGFTATIGQQFDVLRYRQISGLGFSSVTGLQSGNFGFSAFLSENSFRLVVTRVPAPGSLALLGLAGIAASRRRRA